MKNGGRRAEQTLTNTGLPPREPQNVGCGLGVALQVVCAGSCFTWRACGVFWASDRQTW